VWHQKGADFHKCDLPELAIFPVLALPAAVRVAAGWAKIKPRSAPLPYGVNTHKLWVMRRTY
ncbi:MAG TPA: hypothetical protein QF630_00980, partial [Alphaproteobacteria bacterium]|nr:hypothetical protein [Alphaproteobacteria bacterium]